MLPSARPDASSACEREREGLGPDQGPVLSTLPAEWQVLAGEIGEPLDWNCRPTPRSLGLSLGVQLQDAFGTR